MSSGYKVISAFTYIRASVTSPISKYFLDIYPIYDLASNLTFFSTAFKNFLYSSLYLNCGSIPIMYIIASAIDIEFIPSCAVFSFIPFTNTSFFIGTFKPSLGNV